MNSQIKIYLDTSVPNFLFADDSPEKKEATIDFFDNFILTEKYECYISEYVLAEIEATKNEEKKTLLFESINKYPIKIIEIEKKSEVAQLAERYILAGIIPEKKIMDALHVAVCTVYNINFLVSWNFKHLANINKEYRIKSVNYQNLYFNELRIITPLELIDYGN